MTLVSVNLREQVVRRAAGRCEYCRLAQQTQVATFPVDHVLPVTSVSGAAVPLFNPRTHFWQDHFRWSEVDPAVLEGLTAVGRATIAGLELNHARHLEVRRWLIVLKIHPPDQGE